MATVSVIITTYNIERYIDQCLESVAAQTLTDLEIIVVDDGSTDQTPARIREFADRDPRVVPVLLEHNSPGGVATAANAGLDHATSDWVGFLDGDDFAEPTMFEELWAAGVGAGADLAMCQYLETTEPDGALRQPADARRWAGLPDPVYQLDVPTTKQLLRFIAVPWRKLYRRQLLTEHGIRFPVGDYFYEDNPFHWFCLTMAESIAMVPEVLCYHRIGRVGQTMVTADARLLRIFRHHDTIRAWLVDHDLVDDYDVSLLEWVVSQAEWVGARTPKALRRDLYDQLRPIFSSYPPQTLESALTEGRKGEWIRPVCAALVEGRYLAFYRALERRPDTESLMRLGFYHLRRSGVRPTLSMTRTILGDRVGNSELARAVSRRYPARNTSGTDDIMFALSVVQQQMVDLTRRVENLARAESAGVKPSCNRSETDLLDNQIHELPGDSH